jgi:3-oxoacyl-[acyl-carrier-protein] synthase-3
MITACEHIFPSQTLSSLELENCISNKSQYTPTGGIIESITGIKSRYISSEAEYNSSLAIEACTKLFLLHSDIRPESIDLLIFASAGQDVLEPATAHIVQNAIGTTCAVFDVTNACNSFINALEIANAFVKNGSYKRILIATGEVSTKSAKLQVTDRNDFKNSFPGYTFGDIGTAVVIEESASKEIGIVDIQCTADSTHWDSAMLAGGGSRFINTTDIYFSGNGHELKQAFETMAPAFIESFLKKHNLSIEDIPHVFVHQVSVPYFHSFMRGCELTENQAEETVSWCGNVAAGSLPLAWSLRAERKQLASKDFVLLVGLAGGVSLGVALIRI